MLSFLGIVLALSNIGCLVLPEMSIFGKLFVYALEYFFAWKAAQWIFYKVRKGPVITTREALGLD
jgi:hypothetical protein